MRDEATTKVASLDEKEASVVGVITKDEALSKDGPRCFSGGSESDSVVSLWSNSDLESLVVPRELELEENLDRIARGAGTLGTEQWELNV
jgi:hypothetical protein